MGPNTDWPELIDDVLIDVDRLDRLVEDLLALARLDETGAGGAARAGRPRRAGRVVTAELRARARARRRRAARA